MMRHSSRARLFAALLTAMLSAGVIGAGGAAAIAAPGHAAVASASVANRPLAGEWLEKSSDTVFNFVATGPGAYSGQVVGTSSKYCLPIDIKVKGKDDKYSGSEEFYDPCGTRFGVGTIKISIAASGATASAVAYPPGDGGCDNCQPVTWTRLEAGVYTTSAGTALDKGWPVIANHAASGSSCSAPYTVSLHSDATAEDALVAYQRKYAVTVPWLSVWSVDAPSSHASAQTVGLAAGKAAAKEIGPITQSGIRPTYVILDPDGSTCGSRPGWHLPLASWKALVAGWDSGVGTVAGLTPAVLLTTSQYTADGGKSYPHVFVSVELPASPGGAKGANVAGYDVSGAGAHAVSCARASGDTKTVLGWHAVYSFLQLTSDGVSCGP
jgi:hypothetical protein